MQESQMKQLSSQMKQITAQRDKIQKRIDSLYMDKLDGIVSPDEYLHYKEQFTVDISKYDEQITNVQKQISQLQDRMNDTSYQKKLVEKYSNLTKLTLGVAEDFIESIYVGNLSDDGTRKIDIHLKI